LATLEFALKIRSGNEKSIKIFPLRPIVNIAWLKECQTRLTSLRSIIDTSVKYEFKGKPEEEPLFAVLLQDLGIIKVLYYEPPCFSFNSTH
jgi:hypothetical protein